MTLVDSGNSIQFENQFRRFENSNSNGNEKKSESRPPSVAERLLSDMDMEVQVLCLAFQYYFRPYMIYTVSLPLTTALDHC
jgi:hypothetical protein